MKKQSRQVIYRKLDKLYADMESAYDVVRNDIGLSCMGCPRNCCVSYFQHHTYVEWLYLWHGLKELPEEKREAVIARSHDYVTQTEQALELGKVPGAMCPLNDDGLCALYKHRLMICRMHGVPNFLRRPDGKRIQFQGCWRCVEAVEQSGRADVPFVDRTPLYVRLVELEKALLGNKVGKLPKVDFTIAQMIVMGPPNLSLAG